MKSMINVLGRSGLFVCFITTFSLMGMQKEQQTAICKDCLHKLTQQTHILNQNLQNPDDHARTITIWAQQQTQCKDCIQPVHYIRQLELQEAKQVLESHSFSIVSPREKKWATLRNKGTIFITLLYMLIQNEYPELKVFSQALLTLGTCFFLYECFTNNPAHIKQHN